MSEFKPNLIIPEYLDPRDYVFGGVGGSFNPVLKGRNWLDFLPSEKETQYGRYIGSNQNCTAYSLLNIIEMISRVKWGLYVNYSDRALGSMAGTTRNGNYLEKVVETARTKGLLLESDYSVDMNDKDLTWDKYYEPLSDGLKEKASDWLDDYKLNHEWVYGEENRWKALQESPLWVTLVYQGSYQADANGIIHPLEDHDNRIDDHAVAWIGGVEGEYKLVLDSFDNVIKKFSWDYPMRWAKKISLTKTKFKPMTNIPKLNNNTVIKDSTRTQHIALFLDGKKIYQPDVEGQLQILKEGIFRNSKEGRFEGMEIKDLTAEMWDAIPTVNLKNEPIK